MERIEAVGDRHEEDGERRTANRPCHFLSRQINNRFQESDEQASDRMPLVHCSREMSVKNERTALHIRK